MVMRIAKLAALLCLAALTSGCQYSPGMVDRTIAYNAAVADSSNQVLLLNIARASQRHPTYYSRLTGSTSIGTIAPQLQMSIPLTDATTLTQGPAGLTAQAARAALSLTPQFQATETNQLALQTLDDQKYVRGMMTPAGADLYRYFAATGRPAEVLSLMFIDRIEMSKDVSARLRDLAKLECQTPNESLRAICASLDTGNQTGPFATCLKGAEIKVFINNGGSEARTCFQAALRAMIAMGFGPTKKKESMTVVQSRLPAALTRQAEFFQSLVANNLVAAKVSQEKIAVCKPEGGGIGFHLAKWLADPAAPAPEKDREKQCIKAALHQTGNASRNAPGTEDKGRYDVEVFVDRGAEVTPKGQPKPNHVEPKISVALRSVEGMIYYLGQIARAQTEMSIATPITTAELDGLKQAVMIPLFQVKRDSDVPSVVSVDFEGRTYSIPKLCEGECSATTAHSVQYPQHRSLDVLTLVNQLWGLQKEANNQPPAPAVTVIGQ